MRRVQADDTRAFGELYDRHIARALRVARSGGHLSIRAEDAVHTEIAAELSLPEGTVKGRMRLGLKKLRTEMETAN